MLAKARKADQTGSSELGGYSMQLSAWQGKPRCADSDESSDKEPMSPEWALIGDAQCYSRSRSKVKVDARKSFRECQRRPKVKVDAGKSLRGCERRGAQTW
jgi:hypothetical protein